MKILSWKKIKELSKRKDYREFRNLALWFVALVGIFIFMLVISGQYNQIFKELGI